MKIKDQLKILDHIPKKNMGQNFLVNEKVILKIIKETFKDNPKKIIEIGPGLGSLTNQLTKKNTNIVLIEKEKKFVNRWKDAQIIYGDALKIDWARLIEPHTTLVSNLPYTIASRILIDRSMDNTSLDRMVLMFQKEVADRIVAKAGGKDYGILSVIAQNFWSIKSVVKLGPKDFYPSPKVFSTVLSFEKINSDIHPRLDFLKFIKKAFSNRRKKVVSNVKWLEFHLEKFNLSKNTRAEEITPTMFKKLFIKGIIN